MVEPYELTFANLVRTTIDGSFVDTDLTLDVTAGTGARFTATPCRAILWQSTDYADPALAYWAGEAEILEISSVATDTLTVVRGREGTTGISSTGGKTYSIAQTLTSDSIGSYINTYNVRDYGATGDGVTDDSTAVQAAITACASGEGTIYFPPGTYLCNSTLDFTGSSTGHLRLLGAGPESSVIKCAHATLGMNFQFGVAKGGVEITSLAIAGDQTGPDELIEFNYGYEIFIHDCHFKDAEILLSFGVNMSHTHIHNNVFSWNVAPANSRAIYLRQCSLFSIANNTFEGASATTKFILADGVNEKQQLSIIGNTFTGTYDDVIQFGQSGAGGDFDRVSIIGNVANSVTGQFFAQSYGTLDDSIIANNIARGTGASTAIEISITATNVSILNNSLLNFSSKYNVSGFASSSYIIDNESGFSRITDGTNNLDLYPARVTTTQLTSPFQTVVAANDTEIDLSAGRHVRLTLGANVSNVSLSNPIDGELVAIKVIQSGSFGVDGWPTNVKWRAGSAPTITTGAGAIDIVTLLYSSDDTEYIGSYDQDFS